MANKKQENKEEVKSTYVPKKTNKGLIITLIVIASLVMIASIILPFVLVIFLAFIFDGTTEFEKVNDTTINIPKASMVVSVENTTYDAKSECFILSTKTDKDDTNSNDKFFSEYSNLEVMYTFKDEDGYIVGNESLYINNIDKYSKWKQDVNYCGPNASKIKSYEVESVEVN